MVVAFAPRHRRHGAFGGHAACTSIHQMHAQPHHVGRLAELENTDAEPWHLVLRERASGERALLCAVLADAVRCLTRTIGGQPKDQARLAIQARRWVMKRGEDWPYSFENVCAALGLHPRLVRRRLLSLAREFERGR